MPVQSLSSFPRRWPWMIMVPAALWAAHASAQEGVPVEPAPVSPETGEPAAPDSAAKEIIITPESAGAAKDAGAAAAPAPEKAASKPEEEPEPETEPKRTTFKEVFQGRPAGTMKVNFKNVELTELITTISQKLKINFIVPDGLRWTKVSIYSEDNTSPEEFWAAFVATLHHSGLTLAKIGNFYKITEVKDAKGGDTPISVRRNARFPVDQPLVTWLYRLDAVDANQVVGPLKQIISRNEDVQAFTPGNLLIMTVLGDNVPRLRTILKQLDVQGMGESLHMVQIVHATAQEIADKLNEIYSVKASGAAKPRKAAQAAPQGQAPVAGEEGVVEISKVIPEPRTNKLIIIANDTSFQQVKGLIEKLDIPVQGDGRIHVYYLENSNAQDVAATLGTLTAGTAGRARSAKGGQKSAPAGGAAQAADLFEGEVKITADESTNALIIVANQADYKAVSAVIQKLDITRKQVYVEAAIMEIGLDRTQDTGFAFNAGTTANINGQNVPIFFGTNFGNINSVDPTVLASLTGFLGGLRGPDLEGTESLFGIALPSFGALVQLLQRNSDVNVISTPHILTTDNEEATIVVGENVPFQSGFTNALGGVSGLSSFNPIISIQRQDVALTLKVKPQINEGDLVRLTTEVQVSEVAREDQLLGPTTSKREAKTVITMRDQATAVVGGLMRDRVSESQTKVPFLGDIPILGWLFRSKSSRATKTNLLLMFTPYIVRDHNDFRKILERKMKEREEFVDRFYGASTMKYQAYLDHDRKPGPLASMKRTLEGELERAENGGPGAKGEIVITPEEAGPAAPPAGGNP